jgi:hypothetical protein
MLGGVGVGKLSASVKAAEKALRRVPIVRSARKLVHRHFGPLHAKHWRPGPLPDFVIIGAQKAGTTTLFDMLAEHPEVGLSTIKEVHYFDHNFHRGEEWYRRHFDRHIAGEASPNYIFHPLVHDRMKALIPDVKVIAILRDPVERALSHYFHEVAIGSERLPIVEALKAEDQRTGAHALQHFSYVARSRYLEQLERWQDFDLLVLSNRELRENPDETFARLCRHIGASVLPAPIRESNVGIRGEVPEEARRFLEERLAGKKEAVEARYGIRL